MRSRRERGGVVGGKGEEEGEGAAVAGAGRFAATYLRVLSSSARREEEVLRAEEEDGKSGEAAGREALFRDQIDPSGKARARQSSSSSSSSSFTVDGARWHSRVPDTRAKRSIKEIKHRRIDLAYRAHDLPDAKKTVELDGLEKEATEGSTGSLETGKKLRRFKREISFSGEDPEEFSVARRV